MKRFILSFLIISVLVNACSKSDDTEIVEVIDEIEQIFSCVSYDNLLDPQNTNQDDLIQYWTKFVDDVK